MSLWVKRDFFFSGNKGRQLDLEVPGSLLSINGWFTEPMLAGLCSTRSVMFEEASPG